MKRLKVDKTIECMNCLACELVCAQIFYKNDDIDRSHVQVRPLKNDPQETRPVACVQCGKCAKACTHEAITQLKNGVYTINKKKCVGCGDCVEACPFHLIVKRDDTPYATKCIACGKCADECPAGVLSIVES